MLYPNQNINNNEIKRLFLGLLLVGLGIIFLLRNLNIFFGSTGAI